MAYTLKTSGIATNAIMVLAIDQDGTTIKEFVSSGVDSNKVLDTGVAAGVGSSTWKSTSRGYFQTFANTSIDFFGIRFAASHRPSLITNAPYSFFAAVASMSDAAGGGEMITIFDAGTGLVNRSSTGGPVVNALVPTSGTTSLVSSSPTKQSFGYSDDDVTAGTKFYYGLESGSLAADGTNGTTGHGFSALDIFNIGGGASQGNQPGKWHIIALFNAALTLSDFQALHNDWFGTLFDAPGNAVPTFSGSISNLSAVQSVAMTPVDVHALFSDPGDTLTYTASPSGTSWPSGLVINSSTGIISGTLGTVAVTTGLKVRATDTAAQTVDSNTFSMTVSAVAPPQATIILTSDGTTPRASLSGLKWAWFDNVTPNLFSAPAIKGSLGTTDGSGVFSVSLTGTTLSVGQTGFLIVTDSDGTATQSPSAKAFAGPVVAS